MGTVMFEDDLAISGTAVSSPLQMPRIEPRDIAIAGGSCDSGRGTLRSSARRQPLQSACTGRAAFVQAPEPVGGLCSAASAQV